jgi:hypothetical protein
MCNPTPRSSLQRYVHTGCMAHWRAQLALQKGPSQAARCDICRAPWKLEYQGIKGPVPGRLQRLGSTFRAATFRAEPLLVAGFSWWRAGILARGILQGMEAGALGFRLGIMQWHSTRGAADATNLACWVPGALWAAGVLPTLQYLAFLAFHIAAQGVGWLRAVCQAYVASSIGFFAGVLGGLADTGVGLAVSADRALRGVAFALRSAACMAGSVPIVVGGTLRFVALCMGA